MEKHKQWALPKEMFTAFKLSFMNTCREISTSTSYFSVHLYQVKSPIFKSVYKMLMKEKNGFNVILVKFIYEENLVGDLHLPYESKAFSCLLEE